MISLPSGKAESSNAKISSRLFIDSSSLFPLILAVFSGWLSPQASILRILRSWWKDGFLFPKEPIKVLASLSLATLGAVITPGAGLGVRPPQTLWIKMRAAWLPEGNLRAGLGTSNITDVPFQGHTEEWFRPWSPPDSQVSSWSTKPAMWRIWK